MGVGALLMLGECRPDCQFARWIGTVTVVLQGPTLKDCTHPGDVQGIPGFSKYPLTHKIDAHFIHVAIAALSQPQCP